MGSLPGKPLELVLRFYGKLTKGDGQTLDYRITDCFHRTVVSGNAPLNRIADGDLETVVKLTTEQAKQLYYGEWFDANALLKNKAGNPIKAFAWHYLKLKYETRDKLVLPLLPEKIEETPYGKLKLVDVIKCGKNPAMGPHPYKEGGIRASWVGRRAYATWKQGVTVEEFKGENIVK